MDNVGFIASAYIATLLVVGGYTLSLRSRLRRARLERPGDDAAQ